MSTIAKVIEVIAEGNSIEEAMRNAVAEAGKSVRGIRSVYAENIQAMVEGEEITKYRVNAKISFVVE